MTGAEEQDPLINTVLGGARIQRRVSAGLLANVYLGHYERLNVPVAVKVLSPKATAQGMNKERFVREGRALAQLSHPNIIKIYNVGHENGRYFIVMDWIQDGMNLRQLAISRPLTPPQSLKVARRLTEALDYIHQKQLIHRDLKPANVCLRKGGHPVLMDFSLIKDQSSDVQLTAPGTIMGTVNFMPPEQAQPGGPFGNVGPWSDVYSLGGTLYWLLTGRPPFKGRTPMETIIKLIREPVVPPSQINPTIPPDVDALIAKAFTKKADERFQSARDFAAAIDDVMARCADALARSTPPPLASEDDAGGPPAPGGTAVLPPGTAAAAQGGAGAAPAQTRNWGRPSQSSGVQPALGTPPGAPAPVAAALAAPPAGAPARPAARSDRQAPIAPPPSPAAGVPAPRSTGRLGSGSGEGRLPAPAPAAPPEWAQANGLDVPPDDAQTVKIRDGARPGAPPARPGSGTGPLPAPAPASAKNADPLRRSWVEDAPTAPSWTDQVKDPNSSVLGMRRDPNATVMPIEDAPAPAAAAPPEPAPAHAPKPAAARTSSDDRIIKAPNLPANKKSGGAMDVVLKVAVVGAIVIIVVCLALVAWVVFRGSPS